MNKSKFIVFTLLIALFSLCFVNFGSNKQEVYAAEATLQDEAEIAEVTLQDEADIAAANVPSTVILSFPVTHISSYGNEINWEVIYGEEYVSYDRDANWMVVSRSTEEDRTATLKVTVSDGENSSSATKTITIPAGFTAAPVYKINYNLNDGVNNENNPSTYKLGDATITLQNPTKEGYTFQGWEDEEGNKIEKILVGSRKEISLTATWAEKQLSDVVIKTQPTKLTYNALENFDATGLVVTEYYDNGTQQDVTYVGNESSFAFSVTQLQGTDNGQKVVVTYEGYELETSALTVNRLTYDMSHVEWNHSSPYTYNGEEKEVVLTGLPNGVTATYENNKATKVGNYTASVILDYDEVNYNAPEAIANLSWSIVATTLDMSNVEWNYTQAFTYDGNAKEVLVTGLPNGVTANYEDNDATNAGDYQAKVTFAFDDENYDLVYGENEFSATLDWSIDKAKVYYNAQPEAAFAVGQTPTWEYVYMSGLVEGEAESLINLENVVATYWQGEQEVQITQLPAGAQFTAKFTGATADNYDVVINDYTGSISTVSIYFLPSQTYTYNTQAQTFAAKAYYNDNGNPVEITDGTISYSYEENDSAVETNAGTYKVTVTLSGSQYGSLTSIVDFVIKKAEISMKDAAWNYTDPYTYDPEETRTVSLTLPTLVTATYQNNSAKDAANYTAVATLSYDKVNYELINIPTTLNYDEENGTISLDWVINPAQIDMSAVAWDYTDALVYSKSGHTVEVKNLPANVTVQYTGNTGTDVDNYQATATFTPADNYVLINNNLGALNWEIVQAEIDMSEVVWDYTSFTYNGQTKTVKLVNLPEELVTAEYTGNTGTNADSYEAVATLIYDTTNYKLVGLTTNLTLEWSIAKAKIDMTGVDWVYEEGPFTYDSFEKEVLLSTLPEGVKATYSNNKGTDAQEYTATVELAPVDAVNYELINVEVEALTWEILKADYAFEVEWNYTDPYTYSGSAQSVEVTNVPTGLTPVYTGTYSATDANTYTVTVTFTNSNSNYNDTDITSELTWTINPKTLTNDDVTITVLGEDRNEQNSITLEPGVEVMYNAVKVTTYALSHSYDDETNEGVVTITLNGNYTGTLTAEFTASDYGQAYVDAQTLATSLEDPTSLPLTVGSSNVFWTNLPTGLVLNQETGALSYAKPEADLVYVVEATVYYGLTSTHVVEVTITITGVNQQTSNGVITEGESSQLTVELENNADYVVYVEGVEQETVAAYNIDFADHTDGDKVTVRIPVPVGYESENLTVWHKVGEEYVNMNAVKEDGYLVFTAVSFSPYVVTVAPDQYTVTVEETTNGTATVNKLTVYEGQSVILTVEPNDGYKVSSITLNGTPLELVENKTEYVIENVQNDTTIVVVFEEKYTFHTDATLEYIGVGTTNMTGENDAIKLNLNSEIFNVVGSKNESSNLPGLNKEGDIRLYSKDTTNGSSLTVTSSANILAIKINVKKVEENSVLTVLVNESEVSALEDGTYIVNATSFTLKNVGTAGQVQITSVEIDLDGEVSNTQALDSQIFAEEKAALNINTEVADTLELPEAGLYKNTVISWESDNDSVIEIIDGIVTINRQANDTLVTLTATITRGNSSDTKEIEVTVMAEEVVDSTKKYVKVTSDLSDWSGTYLIVYEEGNVAFNGGLETLDATLNTIAVTISNNEIVSNATNDAATFTITKVEDGYTIKSASGYYIGRNSSSNGLDNNNSTQYKNTISLGTEGVIIKGEGGPTLQYYLSGNSSRFRFYASSQKTIQLYKLIQPHTCQYSEATCEAPATCTICGATQGEALGHTEVKDAAVEATCTTTGLTEGSHCSDCNKVLVAQETVAVTSHSYVNGTCSVCGATESTDVTPTTVTVSVADYADSKTWENGTQYSSITLDSNITVTAEGGANTGKYYTSGEQWRIYQSDGGKITFEAKDGYEIKSIKITYANSNNGVLKLNNDDVSSNEVVYVNSNTAIFTASATSGTSGQARITSIEVVYTTSSN